MRRILLAVALTAVTAGTHARAESVADFYKGKTVRIIVGVGVGSGYDINARALARHLSAHIPGNPTVIVQNQPGAGSVTMTNALYNNGPFDGTAIGASFNGLPTTPLLQPSPSVRFEATKLNWIGSTNRESQAMYVWHTAPQQTLDDLYTKEMIVGAQAPGSTQYDYPVLARALFGMKFKVITGYEATPENPSRHGARRGARHLGQLVDAEGDRQRLAQGQEDQDPGAVGPQEASGNARRPDVPRRGQDRRRQAGVAACSSRGSNSAGRSTCRRTCRRIASRRCGARSTPP